MSNCSCFSEEGQSYWKRVVTKYQKRIRTLTARRCEIKHRLEVMRLQMPAYFCYNLMQLPPGAEGHVDDLIRHLQSSLQKSYSKFSLNMNCSCDPSTLRGPLLIPDSVFKKEKDPLTKKECFCKHCASAVVKKLQAEREEDAREIGQFEQEVRKPSIKRICHCDICRIMIPQRPCVKPKFVRKELISVDEKKVCACAKDAEIKPVEDSICECYICADEVMKRIQSSATKFDPVPCGCEGPSQSTNAPQEIKIDIPICQCDSCKEELNKRKGSEVEEKVEEFSDKCFCKSGEATTWLCDCSTCAAGLQRTVTVPCDCNASTDIDDVPLCSCNICKRDIKVKNIDDVFGCICECDECTQVLLEKERIEAEERKVKEEKEDIICICNCKLCRENRKQFSGTPKTVDASVQSLKDISTSTSTDSISSECRNCKTRAVSDVLQPSAVPSDSKSVVIKKYKSEPCTSFSPPSRCDCSQLSTSSESVSSVSGRSVISPTRKASVIEENPQKEEEIQEVVETVHEPVEEPLREPSIESGLPCKCPTNRALSEEVNIEKRSNRSCYCLQISTLSKEPSRPPSRPISPELEIREVLPAPINVINLHTAAPPKQPTSLEEYDRKLKDKWLKETISECSCVKDLEYDEYGNRPKDCSTVTDECCCERMKTDKFSKLTVEVHVKKKPDKNEEDLPL